jgi:hypothetical protein
MELHELVVLIQRVSNDYLPADDRNPITCDTRRPAQATHVAKGLLAAGVIRKQNSYRVW